MSSPTNQSNDLEELPGFAPTGAPEEFVHPDSSRMGNEGQETTWEDEPAPSPAPERPEPRTRTSSSQASIEDVESELQNFAGGLFELLGMVINRFVKTRTKTNTSLWLVAEDEAEAFGDAAGRIAMRRVPSELTEGDGADALIMGSVIVGYGARNITGVSREEFDAGHPEAPAPPPQRTVPAAPMPPPRFPGPPTAPERTRPTTSPVVAVADETTGVAPAEPAPPSVIDPSI